MIARPKISRNERKTTEIGAFEVGNFALLSCPGPGPRRRVPRLPRAREEAAAPAIVHADDGPLPAGERLTYLEGKNQSRSFEMPVLSGGEVRMELQGPLAAMLGESPAAALADPVSQ